MLELVVSSYHRKVVVQSLTNQHAIKGITMIWRQRQQVRHHR